MSKRGRYRHLPSGHLPGAQSRDRTSVLGKLIIGTVAFFGCAYLFGIILVHIYQYAPSPLSGWLKLHWISVWGAGGSLAIVLMAILTVAYIRDPLPKPHGPAWRLEPSTPCIVQHFSVYQQLLDGSVPALTSFDVTVVCVELYEPLAVSNDVRIRDALKRFVSSRTSVHELYRKHYGSESVGVAIEIELPATLPVSYEGKYLSYAWRLEVAGVKNDGKKINTLQPFWVSA